MLIELGYFAFWVILIYVFYRLLLPLLTRSVFGADRNPKETPDTFKVMTIIMSMVAIHVTIMLLSAALWVILYLLKLAQ